jgi:CRP-like cAMP-binding protein
MAKINPRGDRSKIMLIPMVPGPSVVPMPLAPPPPPFMTEGHESGLLAALLAPPHPITIKYQTKRARLNIVRAGESNQGVLLICEGWALRFAQLPNGKRQVLSVVLPGEIANATSLFDDAFDFSVLAVTDVRYCYLEADDVRSKIQLDPAAMKCWAQLVAAEHRMTEQLLVDLGQRTAHERIAAFIVRMKDRMSGGIGEAIFSFPLRQQQLAEMLGLTPVHVCRVLSEFRKNGYCDISDGAARIFDIDELRQIGTPR